MLQRLTLQSEETRDGRLVSFQARAGSGLAVIEANGKIKDGKLVVELADGSEQQTRQIPWELNYRGIFAIEQSLRARPMEVAGETRNIKLLVPGQYELATAQLRCSGKALVPLLDGSEAELVEINTEIKLDSGETIYTAIWTDKAGKLVRTYSSALNLISYRTDQETAQGLRVDDLVPVSIQVTGDLERPAETKRVAYRISPLAPDLQINPAPGQYVRETEDGKIEVLISRQPEKPSEKFISTDPKPTDEDRQHNFFVDSRSDIIRKFADAAVAADDLTKAEIAATLTESAHRIIRHNPAQHGLARGATVARVGEGGAAQVAVFLAALMRAESIPARIAVGLRYDREIPGRMIGHVWTIAYVDNQWVHYDATEGIAAAADRIVFSISDLSERNENEAFEPLSQKRRQDGNRNPGGEVLAPTSAGRAYAVGDERMCCANRGQQRVNRFRLDPVRWVPAKPPGRFVLG